jgi:hypothetical protein
MKEPDHHKDIAIAYTLHMTDGKPDWSGNVEVRLYRCVNPFSFISPRWKIMHPRLEETYFPSLEEAIIFYNMRNIKVYKTREGLNPKDMTPKTSLWAKDFKNIVHVTRTMRKLETIRRSQTP